MGVPGPVVETTGYTIMPRWGKKPVVETTGCTMMPRWGKSLIIREIRRPFFEKRHDAMEALAGSNQ